MNLNNKSKILYLLSSCNNMDEVSITINSSSIEGVGGGGVVLSNIFKNTYSVISCYSDYVFCISSSSNRKSRL